jgi:superoxide dismutase, Cu-Zn family
MQDVVLSILSGMFTYVLLSKLKNTNNVQNAICTITSGHVQGYVLLQQIKYSKTMFSCFLSNLTPGKHGFHIHSKGDLRENCKSLCSHYNPHNTQHGGPTGNRRHKGDLGNIIANVNGMSNTTIISDVSLNDIIGRSIVIHEYPDDLGMGNNKESISTGNSGKRIGCGVIGLL